MIVSKYIAVLALMMLVLAWQVIAIRRRDRISLGDGGDKVLGRRIRVFGNFSEYTPMIIGLLIACELSGVSAWKLHVIGVMAIIGRILHALSFQDFVKDIKAHLLLRQPGMVMTLLSILLGAIFLLIGT